MDSDRETRRKAGDPADGAPGREQDARRHASEQENPGPGGSMTETGPGEGGDDADAEKRRGREHDIARRQMPIHR